MVTQKKHFIQLDSLRAFAVVAVAWSHWNPNYTFGLPFGSGVHLFFVLSGFLITGILIDAKEKAKGTRGKFRYIQRNFYIRRFLRIFPLYYAVLLAATIINIANLQKTFPWHFLYASNYYFIYNGGWDGAVSHFWTLSVEEQFYLFWPFLVLFIPTRRLCYVFVIFILIAPLYRLYGSIFHPDIKLWGKATIGSFDSLSMGALLAYFRRFPSSFYEEKFTNYRYLFLVLMILAYFATTKFTIVSRWFSFLSLTFMSIAFTVVINECVNGVNGPLRHILECRVFVYLGTISYGLYILHNFAGIPTQKTLNLLPILSDIPGIRLVLNSFWTLIGAALSWKFFEAPINQLKKYFPYTTKDNNSAAKPINIPL